MGKTTLARIVAKGLEEANRTGAFPNSYIYVDVKGDDAWKFLAQADELDPARVTFLDPNETGFAVNPFELPPHDGRDEEKVRSVYTGFVMKVIEEWYGADPARAPRMLRIFRSLVSFLYTIADATLHGADDPRFLSNFKTLVLWAWSRSPSCIRFDDGALEGAEAAYKDLLARYSVPDVPVVNEDSLLSLLRVSAAFAALTFSTSDGVTLEVRGAHVALAKEFVEEVLEMLEVEDYKVMRGELSVTEEDRKEYSALIRRSELASKVVEALARGPRNSLGLAEDVGHEPPSIRRVCGELKGMGVVEKVSPGYRLTSKGVQLWREFHVTKVTEVTGRGAPPSRRGPPAAGTAPPGRKPSVTLLTDDEEGSGP